MVRAPIHSRRRTKQISEESETSAAGAPRRVDRLAEVVDLCTDAKRIAETLDERLLGYLLAMAIQETRAGMRHEVAAAAGLVASPVRRASKPRGASAGGHRR